MNQSNYSFIQFINKIKMLPQSTKDLVSSSVHPQTGSLRSTIDRSYSDDRGATMGTINIASIECQGDTGNVDKLLAHLLQCKIIETQFTLEDYAQSVKYRHANSFSGHSIINITGLSQLPDKERSCAVSDLVALKFIAREYNLLIIGPLEDIRYLNNQKLLAPLSRCCIFEYCALMREVKEWLNPQTLQDFDVAIMQNGQKVKF